MRIRKLVATTAAIAVATLGSLSAAAQTESVSYTVPLPELDFYLDIGPGGFGDFVQIPIDDIPKFDPSLGTLVDVELSFSYDVQVETGIYVKAVLDEEFEHFAELTIDQLAVGVTFTSTAVDPPTFNILGEVDEFFGVTCFGEPFAGFGCSEYDFAFYLGGAFEYSLVNNILLSDFVGTGFYDGFFFEFDIIGPNFDSENADFVFADIYAFQDPANTSLTIEYFYTTSFADADGDGVEDSVDNCTDVANADQTDADGDGYGNACDADVNNDCIVNAGDLGALRAGFFGTDPVLDFNNDGIVNAGDLGILRLAFFGTPGPSGPGGACDPARSHPSEQIMFQRDEATGRYLN